MICILHLVSLSSLSLELSVWWLVCSTTRHTMYKARRASRHVSSERVDRALLISELGIGQTYATFYDADRAAHIDITDNAIAFVRGKRGVLITFYPATVKQINDIFNAHGKAAPSSLVRQASENWKTITKWQKMGKIGAVI